MTEPAGALTSRQLVELARRQGLTLDERRAEALRPRIESLLARLAALGASLPREAQPPPTPPPRPST